MLSNYAFSIAKHNVCFQCITFFNYFEIFQNFPSFDMKLFLLYFVGVKKSS